ncbi:hypothetical protein B0H10DRAFT_2216262 [Mycena sp. CBHHK59/15]|nr:hypothetical protein B0H10DRAFT_2216262 [Mycena sp. CBHHK59/15]
MAGHLRHHQHATAEEKGIAASEVPIKVDKKAVAKRKQEKAVEEDDQADDEAGSAGNGRKKRKIVATVEKSFSQSKLQVFRGLDIPFSDAQKDTIGDQFLCATQSANLPEQWVEDPEVLKLFMMFQGHALDVVPLRPELGGPLLQQASDGVDEATARFVHEKFVLMSTDGWQSMSKDAVTGVTCRIREEQYIEGLRQKREGRKNHAEAQIKTLLAVPRYADVILSDTDNDEDSNQGKQSALAFMEESPYMELLAAEHSDEEPDDGEEDGSGDDLEG